MFWSEDNHDSRLAYIGRANVDIRYTFRSLSSTGGDCLGYVVNKRISISRPTGPTVQGIPR